MGTTHWPAWVQHTGQHGYSTLASMGTAHWPAWVQHTGQHGYSTLASMGTTHWPAWVQHTGQHGYSTLASMGTNHWPAWVQHTGQHGYSTLASMGTTHWPAWVQHTGQHGYNTLASMGTAHWPAWVQHTGQHGYNTLASMGTAHWPAWVQHTGWHGYSAQPHAIIHLECLLTYPSTGDWTVTKMRRKEPSLGMLKWTASTPIKTSENGEDCNVPLTPCGAVPLGPTTTDTPHSQHLLGTARNSCIPGLKDSFLGSELQDLVDDMTTDEYTSLKADLSSNQGETNWVPLPSKGKCQGVTKVGSKCRYNSLKGSPYCRRHANLSQTWFFRNRSAIAACIYHLPFSGITRFVYLQLSTHKFCQACLCGKHSSSRPYYTYYYTVEVLPQIYY